MKTLAKVVPFYFGEQGRQLFGCFHEPVPPDARRSAVLICQPVGHEYINSHRALRQLAARLAENGFPVLRFDYYGCGDSCGDADDGNITNWLEDISIAIAELRKRASSYSVGVVGLRLGGTLAAMSGAKRYDIDGLVLWDPVVHGRAYLNDLLALQKEMLRFRPKPQRNTHSHTEVLGFPISSALRAQLEELDLLKVPTKPAPRILVVESANAAGEGRLTDHLVATHARVECRKLEASQIWLPTADGSLLVPAKVLQAVVSWMCGVTS
jgi:uncharacterized protein